MEFPDNAERNYNIYIYTYIQGVPGLSRQTARAYSRGQKKAKMLYEVCELTLC